MTSPRVAPKNTRHAYYPTDTFAYCGYVARLSTTLAPLVLALLVSCSGCAWTAQKPKLPKQVKFQCFFHDFSYLVPGRDNDGDVHVRRFGGLSLNCRVIENPEGFSVPDLNFEGSTVTKPRRQRRRVPSQSRQRGTTTPFRRAIPGKDDA